MPVAILLPLLTLAAPLSRSRHKLQVSALDASFEGDVSNRTVQSGRARLKPTTEKAPPETARLGGGFGSRGTARR